MTDNLEPIEPEPDDDNAPVAEAATARRPSPLKALRLSCLDCCNGSVSEVALCNATSCAHWLFRFGRKPHTAAIAEVAGVATHPHEKSQTQAELANQPGAPLKAIKRRCLDCSGGNQRDAINCQETACPSHPYRLGKSGRVISKEQRAAGAERLAQYRAKMANKAKNGKEEA